MTTAATLRRQRETHIRLATAARMEPADHQELHSPTVAIVNRGSTAVPTRRRAIDQRLWDAFSTDQAEAALRLRAGHELRCGQVSIRVSNYEGYIGRSTNDGQQLRLVLLERRFSEWINACKAAGLDCNAAIDVVCNGVSNNQTDKNKRKRKGWSSENLRACLNVYCRARGWAEGDVDEREAA